VTSSAREENNVNAAAIASQVAIQTIRFNTGNILAVIFPLKFALNRENAKGDFSRE
jgi:hypothetical protein